MPEQFGLNVSRLPDINPSTRIRQAVDARCRGAFFAIDVAVKDRFP